MSTFRGSPAVGPVASGRSILMIGDCAPARRGPRVVHRWSAWHAVGVALALFAVCAPAQANSLTNDSFESPNIDANQNDGSVYYWYVRNTTNATGWGRTGNSWTWLDSRAPFWQASDGNQYTELEHGYVGAIFQSFATTEGMTYVITFHYAPIPGLGASNTDDKVNALIDGTLVYSVDGTAATLPTLTWSLQSFSFVAKNSITELRFADGGIGQPYNGGFLDNVSVNAAVPEPGTGSYAVLLVGFGLIGLAARQRRQGAA